MRARNVGCQLTAAQAFSPQDEYHFDFDHSPTTPTPFVKVSRLNLSMSILEKFIIHSFKEPPGIFLMAVMIAGNAAL